MAKVRKIESRKISDRIKFLNSVVFYLLDLMIPNMYLKMRPQHQEKLLRYYYSPLIKIIEFFSKF